MTAKDVVTICISVVTGLGGGAALIWGLSSWLGKVWASRILQKDKRKYRAELEVVKNELGRASQEYLIKFSSLQAERAQIIRDLYKKLMTAQRQMHSVLKPFQQAGEPDIGNKIKTFVDSFNVFYQFYLESRIYFPESICAQIQRLVLILREAHIDITTCPVDPHDIEYQLDPGLGKDRREIWEAVRKSFDTQAEDLLRSIEVAFRRLLGVEDSEQHN